MKKGIIVGCVDPRLHAWLPEAATLIGVEKAYIARIPGPDGIWIDPQLAVEKNGSLAGVLRLNGLANADAFAFVGHTDCAGHNCSDDNHREHTMRAAQIFKEDLSTNNPVHALLLVRGESDADWEFEQLAVY